MKPAIHLDRLKRLHPKVIDLSLGRIQRLLRALGNPEHKLPPVIHVAGTNGKGSVIAFLRAIFEAAGLSAHVYTSPHLVRFNERIRVAGRVIDDDHLCRMLEECERANDGRPLTFFEATTAAAFLAFSRSPADVLLLETGLGGRLDATNVIERAHVTAITPVGQDHQQFLGSDLAGIAAEKAGILRPGVPAVVARQSAEALTAISARAAELDTPLLVEGTAWSASQAAEKMTYRGRGGARSFCRPGLFGPHQIQNAGTAVACIDAAAFIQIPDNAIDHGLAHAHWPARLQRLESGPLSELLPPGSELWLDGGHNPLAGTALRRAFRGMTPERPLYLVAGMLETKDVAGFLRPLADLAAGLGAVPVPGEAAALDPGRLANTARAQGLRATRHDTIEESLKAIGGSAKDAAPRVLICGSLYLAGHVLRINDAGAQTAD